MTRIATLAPFVVAILIYGRVSPAGGAIAAVALLVLALVPRRIDLDALAQIALGLVGLIGGVLIASYLLPKPSNGPPGWSGLALGALLAAGIRLPVRAALGGPKSTQAFLLASVAASGGYRTAGYELAVLLFVAVELIALWLLEPGRPSWAEAGLRERIGGAIGTALALAVAVGLALALPPLHDRTLGYFESLFAMDAAGFNSRIRLGEMRGMAASERKVLRVFGPNPEHLRGVVYSEYEGGRWSSGRPELAPVELDGERAPDSTVVEPLVPFDPILVPLGATAIGAPEKKARASTLGILFKATPDTPLHPVWFRAGRGAGRLAVARPGPADLEVPAELAGELRAIALRWTSTSSGAEQQVRAIEQELSRFTYSLDYRRTPHRDPVLDFLTVHQEGHCEYFASAMVLLLRALGVPARVAGGFLVTEEALVGGYHVVRDKNAHAWVEVFLEGRGWTTVDPTPAAALADQMPDAMGWAAGLADAVSVLAGAVTGWLRARSVGELAGSALALLASLGVYRLLRRKRRSAAASVLELDTGLPCLERMLATLAREGLERSAAEPLERFAARVLARGDAGASREAAASLLLRYAALRYGRADDEGAVTAAMEHWCRAAEGRVSRSAADRR